MYLRIIHPQRILVAIAQSPTYKLGASVDIKEVWEASWDVNEVMQGLFV